MINFLASLLFGMSDQGSFKQGLNEGKEMFQTFCNERIPKIETNINSISSVDELTKFKLAAKTIVLIDEFNVDLKKQYFAGQQKVINAEVAKLDQYRSQCISIVNNVK